MRSFQRITWAPLAMACAACCLPSWAHEGGAAALPDVSVQANYLNGIGTSDAASEGVVTRKLLQGRPTLRPAEVLEFVPGVIVTQHSGEGKANQYYLRGFNLDHGTDFATWVDGMPVNMVTHAHGQGYSDLNFLIPELLQSVQYRKGLYAAEDGDFSSAGTARMNLVNRLPQGLASFSVGENQYVRTLLADSADLKRGTLLYALEGAHHDGPWQNPQNHRKFNGVLRYSLADGTDQHSLTAMAYAARWQATDQIPLRAVQSGQVDRLGAIDPSDRGVSERQSLSWQGTRVLDDGEWRASAYLVRSRLNLFSNFTYFLDNPTDGDQFEQAERRTVLGGSLSRVWDGHIGDMDSQTTLGAQWRHDRLSPVGLYTAVGGQRSGVTQESEVSQSSLGLHAQNSTRLTPWLRSVVGLRADHVKVRVDSSVPANGGQRSDWIASPKLSLVLGPWANTEWFVNTGLGFHSNDARGMTAQETARLNPSTGLRDAVSRADPLVRTRGHEIGLRSQWAPGLQTTMALWQLDMASELLFVGDAGETEASGASRRHGLELGAHYTAWRGVTIDLHGAVSEARFREPQGDAPNEGRFIPGALRTAASLGVSVADQGPWSGHVQVRYFGPRPLIEDNSQRSAGTTLTSARLAYRFRPTLSLALDVHNLFDRQVSDIDYFYTSRLPGEAADGVADRHFHPAEPRTVRLTLNLNF